MLFKKLWSHIHTYVWWGLDGIYLEEERYSRYLKRRNIYALEISSEGEHCLKVESSWKVWESCGKQFDEKKILLTIFHNSNDCLSCPAFNSVSCIDHVFKKIIKMVVKQIIMVIIKKIMHTIQIMILQFSVLRFVFNRLYFALHPEKYSGKEVTILEVEPLFSCNFSIIIAMIFKNL